VAARSLAAVAVRAARVDLLRVDEAGVSRMRTASARLSSPAKVSRGQQPVEEADLDRAADRWVSEPTLGPDRDTQL